MNRDDVVVTFGKEPSDNKKVSPVARIGDDPRTGSNVSATSVVTRQKWFRDAKEIVGDGIRLNPTSKSIRIYCPDQETANKVLDMLRSRNISSTEGMEGNGRFFAELGWDGANYRPRRMNSRKPVEESAPEITVNKIEMEPQIGKLKLIVDTYASLAEKGRDQAEVDSWFGLDGNLAYLYSYESEDGSISGCMSGVQTTDGKLSVYGCNQDEEDISEREFISVLEYDAEMSNPDRFDETFSKTAYDMNTLAMLELKIPEEVVKQKEELTQCKEFEDERVKQDPDKKLKDMDNMKLSDKSVTGKQEVKKGNVRELKAKK